MDRVIIYKQDSGVVAIVCPAPEALLNHGIEAIAKKDVPFGKHYKIIFRSDIPADRSNRDAWTVDDADLNDGVGADINGFDEVAS